MGDGFHPAKLRSVGAVLLDIALAAAVLSVLVVAILTILSEDARGELARAYARQFRVSAENDCPATFGKEFWFSCAGEVRRLNPPLAAAPAAR